MKRGHFHLHVGHVPRSNGHSAVAAAAYNANQKLTHEQQRQFEASPDHRKDLRKGIVSDQLRDEFKSHGIQLSDKATATTHNRKLWTISDGDKSFDLKEFEERSKDPATGKRVVTKRALDVFNNRDYNYTRKNDCVETWVQTAKHAPEWIKEMEAKGDKVSAGERERLWNHAEQAETARDARTAWKLETSFIRELDYDTNKRLLKEMVKEQFTDKGLIADVAVHSKNASDGGKNTHAHVLLTTREVKQNGAFATKKNSYWNSKYRVVDWRKAWADKLNGELEAQGIDTRVTHKSNKDSGIKDAPGEHLGKEATKLEERGIQTDAGDRNRLKKAFNALREHFDAAKNYGASLWQNRMWNRGEGIAQTQQGVGTSVAQHLGHMTQRASASKIELIQRAKEGTKQLQQQTNKVMRDESSGGGKWTQKVKQRQTRKEKVKAHER